MLYGVRPVTAWCSTCHTRSEVMDEYDTDTGDTYRDGAGRTRAYTARPLECGHDAGDAGQPPFRTVRKPDAGLVDRLVALQDAARQGVIL
jgi:hypothetical protein